MSEIPAGTCSCIPLGSYLAAKSYHSDCSTISPGSDARAAPVAPSTEHSTSIPRAIASTMTFGSCTNAASSAAPSPSAVTTFAIPTDDPSRAGLTNTGSPSAASSASTASRADAQRAAPTPR